MISIHAHFDGKVIVPDDPVDLRPGQDLIVQIEPAHPDRAQQESALKWLVENSVESLEIPADLAEQHDHYLYGSPKREA
jgi:hypothetical protein